MRLHLKGWMEGHFPEQGLHSQHVPRQIPRLSCSDDLHYLRHPMRYQEATLRIQMSQIRPTSREQNTMIPNQETMLCPSGCLADFSKAETRIVITDLPWADQPAGEEGNPALQG
jgi:hypothetical protein